MCGLVGLFGPEANAETVYRMADAVTHRGPDDGGTWVSDVYPVAFGHRRLSIVDLSANGHQPMVFADAGLAMVYNGELYNTPELRGELAAAGHHLRGHSDTEVLLRAYQEWGDAALERISGMFALAILDERTGQLILARDRCGQKPLYYCRRGRHFAFASEIKALHAWSPDLRRIDDSALEEYLAYGYTLGPETLTAGVSKAMPGEVLTLSLVGGQLSHRTLWRIPEAGPLPVSEEEAVDRLEAALEDSVRRHMVSDVPVGVLLSGGIDSSLITALAARARPGVRTFSVSFPGQPQLDEADRARAVARHFGTKHVELEMESFSVDILRDLARQFDDPVGDHAIIPTYLLSRRIRREVTVALGGDGGDELFGGYPHYGVIQRQAHLRRLPAPLRALVGRTANAVLPPGARGRNHLAGMAGPLENAIAHVNLFCDAGLRARLLGGPASLRPEWRKAEILAGVGQSPTEKAMISDFRTTLPEGYLAKVDRASMLNSLEVRAPFLGDGVVDFAWREVPPGLKFAGGRDKILPRRLAARLLPTDAANKRKQGFTMPLEGWLRSGSTDFLRDVLLDSSQTLFDHGSVGRLLALQDRGYNNAGRLFSLAMAVLWKAEYGMERS